MKRFVARFSRSDSGDSLVSIIIVFVLMVAILFTIIDAGVFFSSRQQIQSSARNAARSVAIVGGTGTQTMGTPIDVSYSDDGRACARAGRFVGLTAHKTPVECRLIDTLEHDKGLAATSIKGVSCSPVVAGRVGASVTCEVTWVYEGMRAVSFFSPLVGKDMVAKGGAESEVGFSEGDLVQRRSAGV